MAKLRLESSLDILDLNQIHETGLGVQALSGVTGLGLPPVSVQWLEGAGDGATYRGKRVLTRDIDIPFDILGRDRDHLKALLSRFSKILAGECTLVVEEDNGATWTTKVHRVGGGDFAYGPDTIGERDLQTVVTFRAGDPYFTSTETTTASLAAEGAGRGLLDSLASMPVSASQAIGDMVLNNTGDAHAYPLWQVYGPGDTFQAVSPTGETLRWEGSLLDGESLTLDTRTGQVTDQLGANRYADLAPAPRFFSIAPGMTTVAVSLQNTTATSKVVCSWRPRKWMVI